MSLATPEKIRRLQRKLYVKAKGEPAFRFYQLYDKVYREDILAHAYLLCKSNGGASGVDGATFEDIEQQGRMEWLAAVRKELYDQTYRPDAVRRVMIPKPGGGERPLGIPTIRDRVVQTAAKLILEPIFEADSVDGAYGYRPRRSATDAIQEVHGAICAGYTDVVDADLSKYFDTIPHRELMRSVARRIVDRQMLRMIRMWLKTPVEERDEQGRRRMTGGKGSKMGTPQGGVISPLLANIYMHRFLRYWEQEGKGRQFRAKVINYADDFVILSRGRAREALEWTRRVMSKLKLTLNETKTCVRNVRRETFNFLGYTFGPACYTRTGGRYLAAQPSAKSLTRLKEKLHDVLHRGCVAPWPEVVARANRMLRGWANYFRYGTLSKAYRAIDNYVYHRAVQMLAKRHKVSSRGIRKFPGERVFGELGIQRLRSLAVARRSCTLA
jgi:RNA-directed DNA polymerase